MKPVQSLSMLRLGVSRLLGFSRDFLSLMQDPMLQVRLLNLNVAVMLGLMLMAIGAACLLWMFSNHTMGWLAGSGVAGFIALAFLISVHVLVQHLGGFPLHRNQKSLDKWKPNPLRIVFFLTFALIASQALLLSLAQGHLKAKQLERQSARAEGIRVQAQQVVYKRQQQVLSDRSMVGEELQNIASILGIKRIKEDDFDSSPRKALLIGASNYTTPGLTQLPNVANDIRDLSAKLKGMGYAVMTSMDEPLLTIQEKLQRYSYSLKSRDISLIFFSGHGVQSDGHNYFIPVDAVLTHSDTDDLRRKLKKHGLMLTPYIDDLTRANLRLHMIMLDACRDDIDGIPRGLALMQSMATKNVVVSMAASPGQSALDGPKGGNSPYAASLLKHLDKDEDVSRLLRRVTDDVKTTTEPILKAQSKPPQTPWFSASITDLDLRLPPPGQNTPPTQLDAKRLKEIAPQCVRDVSNKQNMRNYFQCMSQAQSRLDREAELIEAKMGESDDHLEQSIVAELVSKGYFFSEQMSLLWENYLIVAPLSLSLIALMIGGMFMRDHSFPSALRAYEMQRHLHLRALLKGFHHSVQDSIDAALAAHRESDGLPRFVHWSDDTDFYAAVHPRRTIQDGVEARFDGQAKIQMWERFNSMKPMGS